MVLVGLCVVAMAVATVQRTNQVIYMDHNGTTHFEEDSLKTYVRVARDVFGNPSTLCLAGNVAKKQLEESRMTISDLLGVAQTEIIFTSGATESNVIIIRGFATRSRRMRRKCMIVTTPIEHASVDNTVASMEGVKVARVRVSSHGAIDFEHLRTLLSEVPAGSHVLVCVIWVNNEIGTIQDVKQLVQVCRRGTPKDGLLHVHLDATQVVGRFAVDFGAMDVDSASFSAHKFYSAHGVGALYLRRRCELVTPMTGGKQEKGVRGGTENVAGVAAMATALSSATDRIRCGFAERVRGMRDYIARALIEHFGEDMLVVTPMQQSAYNTLSVCLPCDSRELVAHLSKRYRICLGVGSACSKGGQSKVLKAIGVPADKIKGSLRISLGLGNDMQQCRKVVRAIIEFCKKG